MEKLTEVLEAHVVEVPELPELPELGDWQCRHSAETVDAVSQVWI